MENRLLLTLTPQLTITSSIFTPHHYHLRFSFISPTTTTKYLNKWDSNSNAKIVCAQKFNFNFNLNEDEEEESYYENVKKKRRWWSEKTQMKKKKSANVLEEVIESLWIFKVFKSFGWWFPFIIISFVLANGPKAFLMTLALFLAQSALIFAFEKLWGKTQRKRRKTSSSNATSRVNMEEEQEIQETRKTKTGSQSWVGTKNGSVYNGSAGAPDLGGWDDVLDGAGFFKGTSRFSAGESQRMQKEKLSGIARQSDTPLVLRFLIAVFPFISTWAKLFW